MRRRPEGGRPVRSAASAGPRARSLTAAWLALLWIGGTGVPAAAQEAGAADVAPIENREVFDSLDLPAPTPYRDAAGTPGPAYWQQRADYEIRVELDPTTHTIAGSETITYTNHSPDSLAHLWLQLDQNLFRPGSDGAAIRPAGERFSGAFPGGGYEIRSVAVEREGAREPVEPLIDGTEMRVTLPEPLAPEGGRVRLHVEFSFRVPEDGADRMGRLETDRGPLYQVAQWYPRMFVYDDVNGWNTLPYLGQGEYYLEYGDFDVAVTVPRDYIVAATGALTNPESVLTAEQRRRLERARGSAETVSIIAPEEVGRAGARPAGAGRLTWRFEADSVRDFAWAASPALAWDAAGWDGILVSSFYPREGIGEAGQPGWEEATRFGLHSVRFHSEAYGRYPYRSLANVAGAVLGMEYPGIVFCAVEARGAGLFGVTDHEVAHQWFPMVVGSDERRHAWMDEGFVTFMSHYSEEAFLADRGLSRAGGPLSADEIARAMKSPGGTQPVYTESDRIRSEALGFLAYRKPGAALILLREVVLGPERFDPAFRSYLERWRWKHPQPADFFRTIEGVAGKDLDWFWRGWIYGTGTLDQRIADVERAGDTLRVTVENRGELVMPAVLEVTYVDGTTERVEIPVQAWHSRDRFTATIVRDGDASVRNVQLDPGRKLPDVDRTNNVWGRGVT